MGLFRQPRSLAREKLKLGLLLFSCGALLCGCGGVSSPPPPPSFRITVIPGSSNLIPGDTAVVVVSVQAQNGFSSNVTVSGISVPAGISVEPASFSLAPVNASQQVTVSAQPNVAAGTYTAQFQGTGGGFTATASTSLVVEPLESNRTDFIRTDGNPMSMVFDPFHQLIYASNPEWNRVDIVSPATKQIVRSVPVASPQGLDLSLDSSLVYVSTQTQQMFAINTSSHAVVQRWFLPASGVPILQSSNESQYGTIQPEVVANGSVLLEVDQIYTTAVAMLEWNPVTNTITPITLPATFEPGLMARSGDGTKVIIASDTEPSAVVIFDSATNSITATRNFEGSVGVVKANPNGTQFIIYDSSGGLLLYDANLNVLGSIPPRFFDTGVVFSQDGGTIFVGADSNGLPATFTVDTNSLQVIGIAPAYVTETPYWVDPTGLIYGAANRGIALDDSTYFQNLPPTRVGQVMKNFWRLTLGQLTHQPWLP